jgi:hypothetical protein
MGNRITGMKTRETVSRKHAVCGYCREQRTFEKLLKTGEVMGDYKDFIVIRWRCTRGHLSFTAVGVDNR